MSKPGDFSFCESVHATGRSWWHIRKLTEAGGKYGGGIDTNSLCGHVKDGWDLRVEINQFQLDKVTCLNCRKALLKEISFDSLPIKGKPRKNLD